MILRSTHRFVDLVELDRRSGIHRNARSKAPDTDGLFAILSGTFCALYPADNRVFFRIGADEFELDAETVVRVSGPADARCVVVEREGRILHSLLYVVSTDDQFEDDPTPFVEPEDFDFGLLVANILQSPARKAVLLERT